MKMADASRPFFIFGSEAIMGASTNGRVQRSATDWEALLARYEKTGRSRAAFCRVEGIPRSTQHVDLWYRKLRQAEKRSSVN